MKSLDALTRVEVPESTIVRYVLYISEDKSTELHSVTKFIENLRAGLRDRFVIVPYSHPSDGYGYDERSHPDLYKNPNKAAPRRDRLFRRAMPLLPLMEADRIVRITLDDDDFWLPWQLQSVVNVANEAYEEDKIVGVGLRQACIAYIEDGRADVVELTHHMNGNKFYVSPMWLIEQQSMLSPWSIPELFDTKNITRMAKAGVELKSTASNLCGWIYARWGENLSIHDKSRYYRNLHQKIKFDSVDELLSSFSSQIKNQQLDGRHSENLSNPESIELESMAPLQNGYRFGVSEEQIPDGATAVAIFKPGNGRSDVQMKIRPGAVYYSAEFLELQHIEDSTVAFVQARLNDGQRLEVTARGRLGWLRKLDDDELIDKVVKGRSLTDREVEQLALTLGTASWISTRSTDVKIAQILNQTDPTLVSDSRIEEGEGIVMDVWAKLSKSTSKNLANLLGYIDTLRDKGGPTLA